MLEYIGSSGELSLFNSGDFAVIIDTSIDMVVHYGSFVDTLESATWVADGKEFPSNITELAIQAFSVNLESEPLTAGATRMYTIPGGVQAEAKKALAWRKEEKRGGTPVGINTARTLAKGGQIGIEKIRHIAKYFPRHEVDKQGKGWKPGTSAFPSNGRIAWALWGGDAAWRWAEAIVERENKKALSASGYAIEEAYSGSKRTNEFKIAHELDVNVGPEFLARVRHDGSGIDRLYKIEIEGDVYVWDDCCWDSLGHVDGDIYTYDAALDDVYDTCEKTHVIIDPSSAIIIASQLDKNPMLPVTLEMVNPEEAQLVADALEEVDWTLVERALSAAVEPSGSINPNDKVDTPAEKAQRATKQIRNAMGEFAKAGQRVAVAGDTARGSGIVDSVNSETGTAVVKLDSGRSIEVDTKHLVPEDRATNRPNATRVNDYESGPIDTSGILGEPRTPINKPLAHLPGTLPPLNDKELKTLLNDFGKYVENMRKSYKPSSAADKKNAAQKWGVTKFAGENSITAAADEVKPELTPDTSDVTPKYLAIVMREDPQAVMDLVAIVPASATSTEPTTYKRKDAQWVYDAQVLMDLKSATPPDVIELEGEYLNDVLKQVDGTKEITASAQLAALLDNDLISLVASLSAAGGLDRNRGNAEELRRYWTVGEGAAKIRWGTPGDWKRCVRYLSKHLGPRAKGYCQLRHKDALGYYTATHAKRDRNNG